MQCQSIMDTIFDAIEHFLCLCLQLLRLAGVMADKRTDDELVVQVAWALSKALQQEPTRALLLQDTQVGVGLRFHG
jgi:hypothetical protein